MAWYLAPSLVRLRAEINARWPDRDKASDGAIGDPAHAARHSEHNPDAKGCVHAIDVDKDGIAPGALVRAAVAHPATWYVIWNRRIYRRKVGFAPELYTGTDPHTGHVHISITLSAAAETNTAPWGLKEDDVSITDAEWNKLTGIVRDQAFGAVQDYIERPDKGPTRDIGDGAQSPILRMVEHGARAALATRTTAQEVRTLVLALPQTAGTADVDETALAAALAPLLQRDDLDETVLAEQIVTMLPEHLAQQVLDGLAQRLQPAGVPGDGDGV